MTKTRSGGMVRPRQPGEGTALATRLRLLLDDLAGRTVDLHLLGEEPGAAAAPLRHPAPGEVIVARYAIGDAVEAFAETSAQSGRSRAKHPRDERYLMLDRPAIAVLGGARAMLSHGVVAAAIEGGAWPEALSDNCLDLLVRVADLWNRRDRPARLIAVYGLAEDHQALPPDVEQALAEARRRLDASITVAGYGSGHLALLR